MIDANSLIVNISVTILVAVMVFVLPLADRMICKKLGIRLNGFVSENEQADKLLNIRKLFLFAMFAVYIFAVLYLTLLARSTSTDYKVHADLYKNVAGAIYIDLGVLEILHLLFTEGIASALSHIHIIQYVHFTQVYMNIALMVPMGYLLPYLFKWFRQRVMIRPVVAAFLISFMIENIQLVTKRGLYDLDDIVSNTIGGFVGQMLYIGVAYVLTHPDWRKELKQYRRWKKIAKKSVLFPFMRKISVSRTTIYATDETSVYDFYVKKLGFRIRKQIVPEDSPDTSFLLEVSRTQVEIICLNKEVDLPEQYLTFSCRNLSRLKKRLVEQGIDDGVYKSDQYTNKRTLKFKGPDHVNITILEEYDA